MGVSCSSPPYSKCEADGLIPICVCPDKCPRGRNPVCGTDKTTYENECELQRYACMEGIPIKVAKTGICGESL